MNAVSNKFSRIEQKRISLNPCAISFYGEKMKNFLRCILFFAVFGLFNNPLPAQKMNFREEVGPFIFHSNFSVSEIANEVNSFINVYYDIKARLKLPDPYEFTDIYIFENKEIYEAFFVKKFPGERIHPSVFTKNYVVLKKDEDRCHIYLYRSEKTGEDLRHEGTHAILHSTLTKKIPIWLDEGLAEYYEKDPQKDYLWFHDLWYEKSLLRIQNKSFMSLQNLEKISLTSSFPTAYYGDSWAWICFMLNGPDPIRTVLPAYIAELEKGSFFASSISKKMEKYGGNIAALAEFLKNLNRQ